jgi:hypothetical protein
VRVEDGISLHYVAMCLWLSEVRLTPTLTWPGRQGRGRVATVIGPAVSGVVGTLMALRCRPPERLRPGLRTKGLALVADGWLAQ